ncbi:MAG: hypothetical protein WCH99_04455 [Verrucomicrobiota bacterium]
MKQVVHVGRQSPPRDWRTQSGAMGVNARWETNKALPWFIEDQQFGGEYVAAGLAFGNQDEVRWGLKVLEWGFTHMNADGMFNHHDCYHSASFFVESTARALLLIEASPWRADFADQDNVLKSKLLTAARWMVRPDVHALVWSGKKPSNSKLPGCPSELPYAHRRYLDAAAIGEAGLLCHDRELIEKSTALIRSGIAFQRPDGVNPEKGGYDCHYQALGLGYACSYYQMVADGALRAEMKPMLDKGFAWLLTRIKDDGTVDVAGNTRTGLGQETTRSGKSKGIGYRHFVRSLLYWSQLTQNSALESKARRIFEANLQTKTR